MSVNERSDKTVDVLRIAIVGAGTAGAAAGILLARAGDQVEDRSADQVTVFERVAEPGPVGAGITIQPTGQAALARIGVLDEVAATAAAVDRLTCVRARGSDPKLRHKPMIDLPYDEISPGLIGLGTHRGNLFSTLFAALVASGAQVRCGVAIVDSELTDGARWLIDATGDRHGPFDLVVVADGSVSELHAHAPRATNRPYPWGALWLVADDARCDFAADRKIHQIVDGAHTLLGFLPTGLAPGTNRPVVSMFWSIRADRVDDWRAAGIARWRDRVLALEPRAEPILDDLGSLDGVLFARYRDVAMYPWHGERIVFIGDAAHATSPQLGQGANLALIDAVALADALADHPNELAAALAAYSQRRRRHLAYYQFATRALTPLFQSDRRAIVWLRDRVFPMSRWLGWLRRRMTRTMVGVDRGIVRRPMPIAELPHLRDRLLEGVLAGADSRAHLPPSAARRGS